MRHSHYWLFAAAFLLAACQDTTDPTETKGLKGTHTASPSNQAKPATGTKTQQQEPNTEPVSQPTGTPGSQNPSSGSPQP